MSPGPRTAATLARVGLALLLYSLPHEALAAPGVSATPVLRPPRVDGTLNDPAWRTAIPVRDFVQRNPEEGAAPGEKSELYIVYQKDAIYIGLRLLDDSPERIRRGLGRRDAIPDSDMVTVFLDPVLSRDRAYFFRVNVSGVMADGVIYAQNLMDFSWDGLWEAATEANDEGWTAELRIPLTSIAYRELETQSFGLYVERYIQRTHEQCGWPAMPKSSTTFVSRFGRLGNLRNLSRSASLHLLPYAGLELQLGRPSGSTMPDEVARPNAGLDLRYAASGGTSISLSVNPDFGQVEEDPAVVNLSPNEIIWPENRPFFVSGATLFTTPITLLHTRRIGARPQAPATADGAVIEELDVKSRIIGAAKIIGDLGQVSYGLLDAVVLPAHAIERRTDGSTAQRVASMAANAAAGRLVYRPAKRTTLGVLATGMHRFGETDGALTSARATPKPDDAYSAGFDWDLRSESGWLTRGQLSLASADAGLGYGLFVVAGQQGAPVWRFWVEAESFSEDFQINDLGYQWRANMARFRTYAVHRLPSPWGRLREMYLQLWGQYGFNHEAPDLAFERRVQLDLWFMWSNLWELWAGFGHRFLTLDDRETRGGPVYSRPSEWYGYVGGRSDNSARVFAEATVQLAYEGEAPAFTFDFLLTGVLWDRLTTSCYLRYTLQRDFPRWVKSYDAGGRSHAVFGDLKRDELEARLSTTIGLLGPLTLQLFGQLLYSAGTYDRYRELLLLADGNTALGYTGYRPEADFSSTTLLWNSILRWDLGGGAAAFLVYKMAANLERTGPLVAFNPREDLLLLTEEAHNHLLALKLSYGWDL